MSTPLIIKAIKKDIAELAHSLQWASSENDAKEGIESLKSELDHLEETIRKDERRIIKKDLDRRGIYHPITP